LILFNNYYLINILPLLLMMVLLIIKF